MKAKGRYRKLQFSKSTSIFSCRDSERGESFCDSMLFFPKALNIYCLAGLLTYPGFKKPSHPEDSGQWQVFLKTIIA
jgi:hypothetical protein